MRLLPLLVMLPFCAAPAFAQQAAEPAPEQVAAAPESAPAHHRLTWEQRFAQANTTHDGHLTMDQAKGGYQSVARHFAEIDANRKGFITTDDIRAWHKQQREARRHNASKRDNPLQPRPALHRSMIEAPLPNSAVTRLPPLPADMPPAPPKAVDSNAPS